MSTTLATFLRSHREAVVGALLVLALVAAFVVPASRNVIVFDVFGPVVTELLSVLSALGHFFGGLA